MGRHSHSGGRPRHGRACPRPEEVAERICAAPGGKTRGILSVLLQAWYDCEYLFNVGPMVFAPPPKVTSGVLRLTRNGRGCWGETAFGQRRKTLRNSLSSLLGPDNPLQGSELLTLRPERLSVEDFISITKTIEKK